MALSTPTASCQAERPSERRRCRDRELLLFVGRHELVAIDQVMTAMGAGRTATYRRVASCVEAGLLERIELVRSEPGLLRATREGLRYVGLGLPVAEVSPGGVGHALRCVSTALALERHHGAGRILTERELRFAERQEGRPLASSTVGKLRNGDPRLHRPDLVILPEGFDPVGGWERLRRATVMARGAEQEQVAPQRPISVEVELTPKDPRRLEQLLRAWRFAVASGLIAEVHYHCAPGQARHAVERAIAKTRAAGAIATCEALPR